MAEQILFEALSKLGIKVRVTHRHWQLIVEQKHPAIKGREKEIVETISDPLEIRRSRKDPAVYLYYRKVRKYFYCVVVRHLNGDGFIITAYLTKNIKEGARIWKK